MILKNGSLSNLVARQNGDPSDDLDTPNGPVIWAHVSDESMLRPLQDVMGRVQQITPEASLIITAAQTSNIRDARVTLVTEKTAQDQVQTFINRYRPQVCLWCPDNVQSRTIMIAHKNDIPVILLNAKSQQVQPRKSLFGRPRTSRSVAQSTFAFASDETAKTNLIASGISAEKVFVTGTIVEGGIPPEADVAERELIGQALAGRPIFLAAGLPTSELEIVADSFMSSLRSAHQLLLILDPASADDQTAFGQYLEAKGVVVHYRSIEGEPNQTTQVFVTDGVEEIGLWYRLASFVYMGGTLRNSPNPNPLEAASLGCVVIHGNRPATYRAAFDRLLESNASICLDSEADMSAAITNLVAPDVRAKHALAGWKTIAERADVTNRVVDMVVGHLPVSRGEPA